MDINLEKEFNICFENYSSSNYMILRMREELSILSYQVQMLLNNNISGLLELNVNYIDSELNLFFNVTSKCNLIGYMSRKKFNRNEFLFMLLSMINNILNTKDYLLYEHNILLDERYIFVEPERGDVYFVYLPFRRERNDFKSFFTRLIVGLADFNGEDSDNYIQKILENIKSELFSLSSLKTLVQDLLGNVITKTKAGGAIVAKSDPEDYTAGKAVASKEAAIKIPKIDSTVKLDIAKNHLPTKKINKINTKFLLLQPLFIVIYLLLIKSNFIDMTDNKLFTALILLGILGCVDFLAYRLLFEGTSSEKPVKLPVMLSSIKAKVKENTIKDNKKAGNSENSVNNHSNKTPCVVKYHGETEIIRKPRVNAHAYLKALEGEEIIELNKKSVLIGRMEEFVDSVINCISIGKIHAEVLNEGGEYYLIDCNSRNGTFINETRLVPNTRKKVINNDLVRFANLEYRFLNTDRAEEVVV